MIDEYDTHTINIIINSLIYNRTQADVDYALMLQSENIYTPEDLRGAYNASDRNRVGGAINYIAALMRLLGIQTKVDWHEYSIASVQDNSDTINALNILKHYLPINADVPKENSVGNFPYADLDKLTFQKANDIERILFEMYGVYTRVNKLFAGDGYASNFPNNQIFDGNRNYNFTLNFK